MRGGGSEILYDSSVRAFVAPYDKMCLASRLQRPAQLTARLVRRCTMAWVGRKNPTSPLKLVAYSANKHTKTLQNSVLDNVFQEEHVLIPRFCRADLGLLFYLGLANLRTFAGKFLSEFFQRIFPANLSALLLQASGPPKNSHPKFTPKLAGTPLQLQIFEPNVFSRRYSALSEDSHVAAQIVIEPSYWGWLWALVLMTHLVCLMKKTRSPAN